MNESINLSFNQSANETNVCRSLDPSAAVLFRGTRERSSLRVLRGAAARALGISLNKLKRACRQYGIPRWPYRQVRSIRSTIQSLEKALEKCESEMETASLKDRLDSLVKKESLVCKFASCGEWFY